MANDGSVDGAVLVSRLLGHRCAGRVRAAAILQHDHDGGSAHRWRLAHYDSADSREGFGVHTLRCSDGKRRAMALTETWIAAPLGCGDGETEHRQRVPRAAQPPAVAERSGDRDAKSSLDSVGLPCLQSCYRSDERGGAYQP